MIIEVYTTVLLIGEKYLAVKKTQKKQQKKLKQKQRKKPDPLPVVPGVHPQEGRYHSPGAVDKGIDENQKQQERHRCAESHHFLRILRPHEVQHQVGGVDAYGQLYLDGNVFRYEVVDMETIPPEGVEAMITGDWDLTLFTCTTGGSARVAVRCVRTDK